MSMAHSVAPTAPTGVGGVGEKSGHFEEEIFNSEENAEIDKQHLKIAESSIATVTRGDQS